MGFRSDTGGPVRVNGLMARSCWLIEARGVPPVLFHHIRHVRARLPVTTGARPNVVQEQLKYTTTRICEEAGEALAQLLEATP